MEKLKIYCVTNKEIEYLEKLNLTLAGVGKKRFKKRPGAPSNAKGRPGTLRSTHERSVRN